MLLHAREGTHGVMPHSRRGSHPASEEAAHGIHVSRRTQCNGTLGATACVCMHMLPRAAGAPDQVQRQRRPAMNAATPRCLQGKQGHAAA